MGSYSLEEYRRWIAPQAASRTRKAMAWIVAAAPGHLVNALALIYCALFYGNNGIPRFNPVSWNEWNGIHPSGPEWTLLNPSQQHS
jgi:hypothetical protein